MKPKPTNKPHPDPSPAAAASVTLWEASLSLEWKYHGGPFGVLVTEPGEPSQPVAFIFNPPEEPAPRFTAGTLENAERVLREPWAITSGAFHAIDLRDAGRPEARRPVPAWMFGLILRPIVGGKVDPVATAVEFRPFCPFLWKAMSAATAVHD